jgi:enamine deaminase RidA (YjgF/YER057c/UK114 family)
MADGRRPGLATRVDVMIKHIQPKDTFALPSLSAGVIVDGPCLFVSGQVAFDASGAIVGKDDFAAQAAQVMSNLHAVLRDGGATFRDVVRVNVFLSDRKYLAAWRELRLRYFTEPFPASTLVIAQLISPDLMIEVEAVAAVPRVVP